MAAGVGVASLSVETACFPSGSGYSQSLLEHERAGLGYAVLSVKLMPLFQALWSEDGQELHGVGLELASLEALDWHSSKRKNIFERQQQNNVETSI